MRSKGHALRSLTRLARAGSSRSDDSINYGATTNSRPKQLRVSVVRTDWQTSQPPIGANEPLARIAPYHANAMAPSSAS